MARETKPGKFKYSLEAVRKVRQIREKQEQEKFAVAQKKYFEEHERTQKLVREQHARQEDIINTFKKGRIEDFGGVLRRQLHLEDLAKRKVKQEEVEHVAEKKRDDQREVFVEKMKDRKIMDKDKEHKKEDHKKLMDNLEGKFFDEIASGRFIRDKIEKDTSPEE